MRILIVDDAVGFRESLARILRGYFEDIEIFEAGNSEEALAILESGKEFDVLLSDNDLIRHDEGKDMLNQLVHSGKHKEMKLILMSNQLRPNDLDGKILYVAKPIEFEELRRLL